MIERIIQEMLECDKATVEDCYILSLCARLIDKLDQFHDKVGTNKSIVKPSPVAGRAPSLLTKW